jgi:hypothetical protein
MAVEAVAAKILVIRGKRVMLDRDLAKMYGVATNQLVRQVKRNYKRFPDDFMYQLTRKEVTDLKCHFGTSSWGGVRRSPYVFTEQGVAMLSGLLNSDKAIMVNIAIMRAFVKLREFLMMNKVLGEKVAALERKTADHDSQFLVVFEAIKQLMAPPTVPEKPKIGFR